MTSYLVDTDVISAVAPAKAVKPADLLKWMDAHSSNLFISAVTIAEIADGVARAKREGAKTKILCAFAMAENAAAPLWRARVAV